MIRRYLALQTQLDEVLDRMELRSGESRRDYGLTDAQKETAESLCDVLTVWLSRSLISPMTLLVTLLFTGF
jgi:hypothetical protein